MLLVFNIFSAQLDIFGPEAGDFVQTINGVSFKFNECVNVF